MCNDLPCAVIIILFVKLTDFCIAGNFSVNKRLDEWVTVERMDLSKLELPQKEAKQTPLKLLNGIPLPTDSRPSSPEKEVSVVSLLRTRGLIWDHLFNVQYMYYVLVLTLFRYFVFEDMH